MASKKVTVLKFVGTVSLGLLTGTTFALSSFTVPALLELPSASTAAKSLRAIVSSAGATVTALSSASGSAFLLAFALSPSGYRHPYLLYTSLLCFSTRLTEYITPTIWGVAPPSSSSAAQRRAALAQARKEKAAARNMEASYEVLGDEEGTPTASGEEFEDDVNGEEVRAEVEVFVRGQLVQTAVAGVGFFMAVLGIWGDGAHGIADTLVVV
ncbi:hypothetical protein GGS20DRAFT_210372 [Poronia punctata]|nr:hypothetical protein GGS20DRAFT_210372 [Poronia punctata]